MTMIPTLNGNWVVALEPAPGDVLVVTTVHGNRVAVRPIGEYLLALRTAQELAGRTTQPVKVLCMSLPELIAYSSAMVNCGTAQMSPADWEDFRRVVDTCLEALRKGK